MADQTSWPDRDWARPGDPFGLQRFVEAQQGLYASVLADLKGGRKRTHWMWFIFPQLEGLGHSATSRHYAIKSLEEAQHYLRHPVLGTRLLECTEAVLAVANRSAAEILGYPDDLKLKSSMTLFATLKDAPAVFAQVLDRYYGGEGDERTLQLLVQCKEKAGHKDF